MTEIAEIAEITRGAGDLGLSPNLGQLPARPARGAAIQQSALG